MKLFLTNIIFLLFFICNLSWGASSVDVEWQGEDLAEVITSLSERLNESMLIGPKVQGSVYLNLKHVTLRQALAHVLSMHGLIKWQEQGVARVEPIAVWEEHLRQHQLIHEKYLTHADRHQKKWVLHYAEAKAIAKLIQGEGAASLLSVNGQWRIDERLNIVWVYDVPEKLVLVHELIKASDVPLKQVMVTVRLASVDQGAERELGLKWLNGGHAEESEQSKSSSSLRPWLGHVLDSRLLDFKLSLLEKHGVLELISSPQLFTLNHQTASIETGEEVPYQESSEGGGTTVAFKKAVLSLKVTPQILPNRRVLLKLLINQDKPGSRIVMGVPSIQTRQIETSVMLNDNQTIVLGGIYEMGFEHGGEGLPFLYRIPLVQHVFGQITTRHQKRQLLIFVTPTVVGE